MKLPASLSLVTLCISCQSWGASLLNDIDFGTASQQTASWESGSLKAVSGIATDVPSDATSGVGSAAPISPGYRGSAGYYSWRGDYGMTATTSIQNAEFSDIQNVVFQRVSMANPGTDEEPLSAYDNLVYGGGATLSYSYVDAFSQTVTVTLPASFSYVGEGVYDDSSVFAGTYYAFTYQWDLSGIEETITSITITAPIIIHSSTTEAQIDIGSDFVQVIPEPSGLALLSLGLGSFFIRRRR
jgi:hypothetical protein